MVPVDRSIVNGSPLLTMIEVMLCFHDCMPVASLRGAGGGGDYRGVTSGLKS